jgi:hypothetical protein
MLAASFGGGAFFRSSRSFLKLAIPRMIRYADVPSVNISVGGISDFGSCMVFTAIPAANKRDDEQHTEYGRDNHIIRVLRPKPRGNDENA